MFTGIIKDIGKILSNERTVIWVESRLPKVSLGDSIAVNGVCLTVTQCLKKGKARHIRFDLSQETLERTTFPGLKAGQPVNIEPALSAAESLGGHIVQGHVDGVGQVQAIDDAGEGKNIYFGAPADIMKYIVPKGSVTLDGVSLTVGKVSRGSFEVYLIPFTLKVTNLGAKKVGDRLNIETDILAKYVLAQKA